MNQKSKSKNAESLINYGDQNDRTKKNRLKVSTEAQWSSENCDLLDFLDFTAIDFPEVINFKPGTKKIDFGSL